MLASFEGLYRNGQIEIADLPTDISEGTRVIVTFLKSSGDIDLASLDISKPQAHILRSSLMTFAEEWDSPEMSIYDNYHAAKKY
ncbi:MULTISPECIES: hypothetical protein [Pseudanabaena]|uniref:Uncharacterized protein n=2 Tax=Pseudanabaena TaxID=1152 RepID=L8MX17_9CYAN|nr:MULTISPECIES: hypothetical protein [Pseudanabaena]ELS30543.1 hypothetical protein Pse7429DRAFT_4300 [Pseudanabaena biceps PCC 7429]MDG3497186.1 hypothetical protein [Pseudanabaena catenata USMAC16]